METPSTPPAVIPSQARAARFHAPGDVRIETVPVPAPGPGEVLVRVLAATTCGTDLKAYRRGHFMLGTLPAPFGHEYAGEIVAIGAGVRRWQPGMRVVGANSAPCGHCFFCAREQPSQCENLRFWNGAYAEYALIPRRIVARNLYLVPDSINPAAAALAEPLACALHGVEAAWVVNDDVVLIVGDGPLGLLLLAAARLRGARVIMLGHHAERLALTRKWGAESVFDTTGDDTLERTAGDLLEQCNEGHGADVVFEAVGRPETWDLALTLARPGGTVCLFGGRAHGDTVTVDAHALHYEERMIVGAFHHTPRTFARAVEAIVSREVPAGDLLSGDVPLEGLVDAFTRLARGEGIKYAIRPLPPATAP
ncbi:MAG TPA: alcohol dehydrogenase catalytic domain-containing protein [Ktedonobacterales bacterium]|nr:alcohol dehydrogenase catalytic domain-containing protein [Ktedonobacterales bacterium]